MSKTFSILLSALLILSSLLIGCEEKIVALGVMKVAQPITLLIPGPELSEAHKDNPFLNYRLIVTFTKMNEKYEVPGYYAADGNAGETSANSGKIWKVHFTPPSEGKWKYTLNFKKGNQLAISTEYNIGTALPLNGFEGSIDIKKIDKTAIGFYSKGKLEYVEKRYLQHKNSGDFFVKGGAGSPENLLAYIGFDGTMRMNVAQQREGEASTTETLHRFEKHIQDLDETSKLWQIDKGKGILGGINYLASKGINSMYFLSMNINGDGKDVWPYTSYNERERFDCSKLDQWNFVFDHMDKKGILMHILLQETENETLLDNGDTKIHRKLYLREMVARFSHHLGVVWDMGEENGPVHWSPNGQSREQVKTMLDYFNEIDPYQNLRVIHSHADKKTRHEMYNEMLHHPTMNGMSMQIHPRTESHKETKHWLTKSNNSWSISVDEIGHYTRGADPDDRPTNNQDSIRKEVLWGNLMAGGSGVEWYFGYLNHNNDLQCEDWRSRDQLFAYTGYATSFFHNHVPFEMMTSADELIIKGNAWCLQQKGKSYLVYSLESQEIHLNTEDNYGIFNLTVFNPRTGKIIEQSKRTFRGQPIKLRPPFLGRSDDWVYLLTKI
ncbi:DUF5060 domain-containing protein [Saprospiraceae bacterium]|nr:DUF5060 domain-containing protein [Saprospiraceae bacterium]